MIGALVASAWNYVTLFLKDSFYSAMSPRRNTEVLHYHPPTKHSSHPTHQIHILQLHKTRHRIHALLMQNIKASRTMHIPFRQFRQRIALTRVPMHIIQLLHNKLEHFPNPRKNKVFIIHLHIIAVNRFDKLYYQPSDFFRSKAQYGLSLISLILRYSYL